MCSVFKDSQEIYGNMFNVYFPSIVQPFIWCGLKWLSAGFCYLFTYNFSHSFVTSEFLTSFKGLSLFWIWEVRIWVFCKLLGLLWRNLFWVPVWIFEIFVGWSWVFFYCTSKLGIYLEKFSITSTALQNFYKQILIQNFLIIT